MPARPTIARIWRRLRGRNQSPARVALAVGSGIFIGCLPVYGAHFFLCLLWCLPLGLDFVATYLAANISNPFIAPFLVTAEVEVGSLVLTGQHAAFTPARAKATGVLGFALQAAVGSVFVGGALALIGAGLAYVVASKRKPSAEQGAGDDADELLETAVLRTVERYRHAPMGDRFYVAGKLRADPLTRMLHALPGKFGRVLDAGAGRGQFSLLLRELGRAESITGFDTDTRKIGVFRATAGNDAQVEARDLAHFPELEVDTVLLFDVLHYLPLAEQDAVLEQAAARVPHGRILIRELDAAPGTRSAMTRFFEWIAKVSGYNRGRAERHYRPAREIVAELAARGFTCEVLGASAGTPFANVLIVASRP